MSIVELMQENIDTEFLKLERNTPVIVGFKT